MSTRQEGRNFEQINIKKILNFGDSSYRQSEGVGFRKIKVEWNEARLKCERCNNATMAKWDKGAWDIGDWKVYLKKSQVSKDKHGYYIDGAIQFYCSRCDTQYNYLEKSQ